MAGTGGSYALQMNYTSDGHAFNSNFLAQVNATPQWTTSSGCVQFYDDASGAIKWNIVSGATGSPTLRYALTLERLQ